MAMGVALVDKYFYFYKIKTTETKIFVNTVPLLRIYDVCKKLLD